MREGGSDANPSRSPSGIRVSAERALRLKGQRNISSPAINRKTDGSTEEGAWGLLERGVEAEKRKPSSTLWFARRQLWS